MIPEELRYTLLTDGSADVVLLSHITWLLQQHFPHPIQAAWADLRRVPRPPRRLADRMAMAIDLYPCDLLIIHRDAEKEGREVRVSEILSAGRGIDHPCLCVVPVWMQEAWLLFDETAIRRAASNPKGHMRLSLPRLADIEKIPDPKELLYELLRSASGFSGRRIKGFAAPQAARRVAEYISDFSPLRALPAFRSFEQELRQVLSQF
jgi:hypothetical protein